MQQIVNQYHRPEPLRDNSNLFHILPSSTSNVPSTFPLSHTHSLIHRFSQTCLSPATITHRTRLPLRSFGCKPPPCHRRFGGSPLRHPKRAFHLSTLSHAHCCATAQNRYCYYNYSCVRYIFFLRPLPFGLGVSIPATDRSTDSTHPGNGQATALPCLRGFVGKPSPRVHFHILSNLMCVRRKDAFLRSTRHPSPGAAPGWLVKRKMMMESLW